MTYKINVKDSKVIERESDGVFIPSDPRNMDFAEYSRWKDSGGAPAPETAAIFNEKITIGAEVENGKGLEN